MIKRKPATYLGMDMKKEWKKPPLEASATIGHNNPKVLVELDAELARFVVENCDTNMRFGLMALNGMKTRSLTEKMVSNIENFKQLGDAVRIALRKTGIEP